MPARRDDPRTVFSHLARVQFGFLRGNFDLELVGSDAAHESTSVVLASRTRYVRIYYGPLSYEVRVEIGREVEVEEKTVQQWFSLSDILKHQDPPVGWPGLTATTTAELERALAIAADLTRR